MEGALEESAVKDLPRDDPDAKTVKDTIITNGLNGNCEPDETVEEHNDSNDECEPISKNVMDNEATDDVVEETPQEDPRDEVEPMETEADAGIDEAKEKEEDQAEDFLETKTQKEQPNEKDSKEGSEVVRIMETESGDNVDNSLDDTENVADHISEMDDISEVSESEDKCDGVESEHRMEIDDDHNNTSDVECLDESVTEIYADCKDVSRVKKADGDDVKESSGDQKMADDNGGKVDGSLGTSDIATCEENGSCSSPDIEEITETKSNGCNSPPSNDKQLKDNNGTTKGKKVRKSLDLSNITPRRSSRNIKRTSYIEKELEEEDVDDDGSDIEEIKPEDPLAGIDSKDKENSKVKSPIKNNNKTTIVVNDTKRLAEIAAGSKVSKGGKKEPTLVIIDTNSILSGRGGVPVGTKSHHHHHHHHHHSATTSSTSSFSVMPMGVPTQAMYPNMRATITPVPMTPKNVQCSPKPTSCTNATATPIPQILPTLTDDMFVVEAPSFIVPYVYEKPPIKPLKDFVTKLEKSIEEREKEDKLRKLEEEKKREEIKDKEKEEKDKEEDEEEKEVENKEDDKNVISENEGDMKCKKDGTLEESADSPDKRTITLDDKPDEKINKIPTYFDLPLGKFFMQIGVNLVQEFVQTDLLRTQKRKRGKGSTSTETQIAINSLIKNLEFSKENNEPFHLEMKKCEFCNFKTESALVMQHHLETPHMRNYVYKCNFCPLEVRSPHDILFHMEAEHNTRGRLERGPAFHQCPNCPFEDNQKGKLTRHILACNKKFRPERNLEPATDWEPPAKIPRMNRARPVGTSGSNALAMAMSAKGQTPLLPKLLPAPITGRGRGRPPMQPRYPDLKLRPGSTPIRQDNVAGMMYRPTSSGLLLPTSYQFGNNQLFQVMGGSGTAASAVGVLGSEGSSSGRPTPIALVPNIATPQSRLLSLQNTSSSSKSPAAKLLSQPSISITPLPRSSNQTPSLGSGTSTKSGGKNTFVICEICDGYIKDLEQLRNHMQWIHKVKIHPKMIYNRPPLNCQKCQFRFFTDQGLERHLLGSHGLVTSSMQEAANKGKDAGRCPACGRVYQWKLLNHVARDHGMTLKPAHLSYKCTVCTATFGMYKQFENHVYSAHSVVAKRVMDKKNTPSSPSSRSNDSLLKPLKINDEITIIPQPAKPTTRSGAAQTRGK
ncbi:uncharacterized protein LOC107224519 isoform X1 [Neodiprion lecontei]|uniref:Uncharacterized protein LOC107224519 isoform X1 n=1 Tax=Neodiprion lecontei TaxID=441921 RepID=A0A6J0C0X8_NEOLC|nr:uncharacterized protein LOC107224519 isoform X1 [Neodiprion lecontei]XP_015520093.2 uncharacterized protein LOC107224519 isoform X1 [Neodiprion lecontei]XP_015520101.2 uncharacterized protein LOC107224519 isoform X1 [Neodiprion lecontei]XP_015520110.2 uncharacterized protein LOC107224519 isoform X1 [Neodiprion lecontei]XP_046586772.1 uncharacterized protein LOC107224519 isoform X1 [Neodiprion lecontei]XP_046586773.1 uncharacterized protein LOC107224519 isoform X1 [Neodiprion lecontei]